MEAGERQLCIQFEEFSRHFVPRKNIVADARYAWPSLMAALRVGMRWTVVQIELMSSHQYHRDLREQVLDYFTST